MKLVSVLAKHDPDWLSAQPELVDALWARWKSDARAERLKHEEQLALPELLETKRLVKCFVNVATKDRGKLGYLFDVLSVFDTRTCVDFTFLEERVQENGGGGVHARRAPRRAGALPGGV